MADASATDHDRDREALLSIYRTTCGKRHWSAHWRESKPVSEWFGVACAPNGRVTALDLATNGLVARALPVGLFQLSELTSLDLTGNTLFGELSELFGLLTKLEVLRLANLRRTLTLPISGRLESGGLQGQIPKAIFRCCVSLREVDLSQGVDLTGSLPQRIGESWSNLERLCLRNCANLAGPLPEDLGGCSKLRELDLRRCRSLTGPLPQSLKQCSKLQSVLLEGCSGMVGSFANVWEIVSCRSKRLLRLSLFPAVTGSLPLAVEAETETLELLSVAGCAKLEGPIPISLAELPSLRKLDCSGCSALVGAVPIALIRRILTPGQQARTFEALFGGCRLHLPADLAPLSDLTSLRVASWGLVGPIPTTIGRCTALRELLLQGAGVDSGPGGAPSLFLPEAIGACRELRTITIDNCHRLTGPLPESLFQCCLKLQSIIITSPWEPVGLSGTLSPLIGNLSQLQVLTLRECRNLSGNVPPSLGRCTALEVLDLRGSGLRGRLPWTLSMCPRLKASEIKLAKTRIKFDVAAVERAREALQALYVAFACLRRIGRDSPYNSYRALTLIWTFSLGEWSQVTFRRGTAS